MTNSAGLIFQYLSLSSTYTAACHCHRDRVYFEMSFSSEYKVANSQWSHEAGTTLVSGAVNCQCQCISCHFSLHHARGSCRPINLINFWAARRIASIGRNVEIRALIFSRWITVQRSQGHVWLVACIASWTYLSHPPNTSFLTIPFTFLPSAKK